MTSHAQFLERYVNVVADSCAPDVSDDVRSRATALLTPDKLTLAVAHPHGFAVVDVVRFGVECYRRGADGTACATDPDALYQVYLEAYFACREARMAGAKIDLLRAGGYYAVTAACVLGQQDASDARTGAGLKTRRQFLAALDAMFDGAAPRAPTPPRPPAG